MPWLDFELAGDDGGGFLVPIVEDFQQVALALIGERTDREVIEQQKLGFGEPAQEGRAALESVGTAELLAGVRL